MLLNSFTIYSITWITILLLYSFNISELYPKLTLDLILFCLITSLISLILGIIFYRNGKIQQKKIDKNYKRSYSILILGFIIEFIYVGKIPLIETLLKTGYTYMDFEGIKLFHGFLLTYNIYIISCVFNDYIISKNRKYLVYIFISIFLFLLLYLRGYIMVISLCCFFIVLFYNQNLKNILKIGILGIIMLYLFGISGNIRHYYKWNDTTIMKEIAKINTSQNLLDPFLWSYVYITSPLGNLQYNFNKIEPSYNKKNFIYENLLPNTITEKLRYKKTESKLMTPALTVSTAYINSYLTYGKIGMYISFGIYILCEIVYLFIIRKTKYYIIGLGLIGMLNILTIFDNLFILMGFSFALFYPVIDIIIDKIKSKKKEKK